jgi:hypothetical protein
MSEGEEEGRRATRDRWVDTHWQSAHSACVNHDKTDDRMVVGHISNRLPGRGLPMATPVVHRGK